MLKLLVLSSALLISSVALADTYQASQLYHQQKYQQAKAEFELLLPLGNDTAAFNLAVMAMNGQGMDQDIELAYSYFSLAAELGHPDALTGMQTVAPQLSAAQKQAAQHQFELWQEQMLPSFVAMQQPGPESQTIDPDKQRDIIERVEPKYPIHAARKGTQGFVSVRLLIDEQGQVLYAKTQHSFPIGVFDQAAEQALLQWRYQPAAKKSVHNVSLSFSLAMSGQDTWRKKLIQSLQKDSWPGALAGIASYQYSNAILLNYLDGGYEAAVDWQQSTKELPQFSDFKTINAAAINIPAFSGSAIIKVNADKKLTELTVLSGEVPFAEGDTLNFIDQAGAYRIAPWDLNYNNGKAPLFAKDKMYLKPIRTKPKEWSAEFWLDQAARNGLVEAQRSRAQYVPQWDTYLQRQNDPVALGWQAIELLTNHKTDEAKAVFKQAQAAGFEATAELEALFQ